ncbi:thiamine pyrophosphate-dependent enzyme [Candidatus Marinimicrobia bacterium]|nr:thiamine pyrophosphate-dependent enzyme [Candidatus Neomarinimicrobiota bacterium]
MENLDYEVKEMVNQVRKNKKPGFIEVDTYRLNAHSKGDDNRYQKEINEYYGKDIIKKALDNINEMNDYYIKIKKNISSIVLKLEKEVTLTTNIKKINIPKLISHSLNKYPSSGRYNKLINEALIDFLEVNDKSIILGEDIEDGNKYTPKDYGGAFKVTKNLSKIFPKRIFNTPISEAAIVGIGAGYSIKAGRSFVEIMFGDFTTLILDQVLQHITKFETMYNGKIKCPIVIRTPMGGKRGYGPTHSQSLEKHFLGIPNLIILAFNHRISPLFIMESISENKSNPVLLIENKTLYTVDTKINKLEGYTYRYENSNFPALIIIPNLGNPIFTVICYGEVLNDLELAARKALINLELFIEIVCLVQISPVDISLIKDSVKKTKNLIIIEEGNNEGAWGSEVTAQLIENRIPIERLIRFGNQNIIPSSLEAENKILPTKENIYKIFLNL